MHANASQQVADFRSRLAVEPSVLVRVAATERSAPREAGSWMGVFADSLVGTIGGGRLECDAIARARSMLQSALRNSARESSMQNLRVSLGPALGQCCGGVVRLQVTGQA